MKRVLNLIKTKTMNEDKGEVPMMISDLTIEKLKEDMAQLYTKMLELQVEFYQKQAKYQEYETELATRADYQHKDKDKDPT